MSTQPPLFTPPKPKPGAHERAMRATLKAWAERSHLTGPEHSTTRGLLLSIARQADVAERTPNIRATSVAAVLRTLNEFTTLAAPPPVADTVDPRAADLEERALRIIDDVGA